MSFEPIRPALWLACRSCGNEVPEDSLGIRCPSCRGLLDAVHRRPDLPGPLLRNLFQTRCDIQSGEEPSGVWRYRELILPTCPEEAILSFPEGNTPLARREALTDWVGVERLGCKVEGMNPTGSFKDRGMTVAVTQARRVGATALACASTGNTSASMAAYAALAGFPALVLIPAGQVAMGKLAQTLAYGARVLSVRSDFDTCLTLLDEAVDQLGVYMVNSLNPYRIEGQKSVVFELLQQLGWHPPDWIVLPAGNLGNLTAVAKGLLEALGAGMIDRLPRIAAVQAEGAAPFAAGFHEGFTRRHHVKADTIATAIRIGNPASWDRAVDAIHATEGLVLTVSDEQILEAKAQVDRTGIGCEPASAAAIAGARALATAGVIEPGHEVVALLTGHLLKDPGIILDRYDANDLPAGWYPIREVDPTLDAVGAAWEP